MERERRLRAPCAGKALRKKRRSSPLPEAAALPGSRAGGSQMCRRRLFGSAGPRGPEPACKRLSRAAAELGVQEAGPAPAGKGLKKKSSGKKLPKIKENVEYTEESSSCNQSNQVTGRKTTDFKRKEEVPEESNVPLKDSKIINFGYKGSLKNAEVTSSTEITLPTGVSTFLIECLDEDSAADYSSASNSLQTYSSPETFRDDDLERCNFYSMDLGKYKNSTLLDSSKAMTIDKIPQMSNLSAILEPVPEDFPNQRTKRKRPSSCYNSSSALSVSATLAGKKLCKITAARERTPDLKSGMRCSSPLGPESKQMTSTMLIMEENKVLKNPGNAQPLELDLSLSPVCKASPGEDLFLNTTGLFVNSEEIVPASLSSEKEMTPQSPEEKNILKPQRDRREMEICSIVRMSPEPRPSRLHQVPVNSKKCYLPKGLPEDSITSTKNWICYKRR
nr:meiosis-specific kinetochore protein isoform X4 [Zonotrichia albicollis]